MPVRFEALTQITGSLVISYSSLRRLRRRSGYAATHAAKRLKWARSDRWRRRHRFLTHPALEPESEGGVHSQHPGQATRRFAPTAEPSIQDAVPTQNRVRSRSMFNPAFSLAGHRREVWMIAGGWAWRPVRFISLRVGFDSLSPYTAESECKMRAGLLRQRLRRFLKRLGGSVIPSRFLFVRDKV